MSSLQLDAVVSAGFQVTPQRTDTGLQLVFSGSGDMTAITLLSDFLKQAHSEARRLGMAQVSCDFQKLSFMNSSCFKSFVVWIDTVKNTPAPYQINFLTNPNFHWQRRSLEALRRLAMNIVTIDSASAS